MGRDTMRFGYKEILKHPDGSIYENGYGKISKKVMCDKNLHVYAKAIYAYLCSYMGGGNIAFPGVSKICGDLKISSKSFYKFIKQLEDIGYIKRSQMLSVGNKFYNNIYEITYKAKPQRKKIDIKTRQKKTFK